MQRRIPRRATPFSPTQHVLMRSMERRQAQVNWWYPGTMFTIAGRSTTILEYTPHVRHLILHHEIRKLAACCIAMIAGDDQPPPRGQPCNELPEIIRREHRRRFPGQSMHTLTRLGQVVHPLIRPVVPEDKSCLVTHALDAVLPGKIACFSA